VSAFAPGQVPPEAFAREMGCTEAEWLHWLPGATQPHTLQLLPEGAASVSLVAGGRLHLQWQALPPRRIALVVLPRLAVQFRFEGADAAARTAFLRRFDLYTQRGGG
jgi:hypothetical protein